MSTKAAKLKIELFCKGLKYNKEIIGSKGRKSGAGPAGGRFLRLSDDIIANVPIWPEFAEYSEFELEREGDVYKLLKNKEEIAEIELLPSKYRFYDRTTSSGIKMSKIALIHGLNCLATTVNQICYYWRMGYQCLFCGIEGSLKERATVARKSPDDLYETAKAAIDEGVCEHMTLTTGTEKSEDRGAKYMLKVVEKLNKLDIPLHVQVEPPKDFIWFKKLAEAGTDTIGVHVETLNPEKFKKYCPGKAMNSDITRYIQAWEYCLDIFGKNQVDTYYLLGIEEDYESLIKNLNIIADIGVIPFLVPIRPVVGAKLNKFERLNFNELINLYREVGKILHKNKLNPFENKAGCVRCNACSAIKEAYKYLL